MSTARVSCKQAQYLACTHHGSSDPCWMPDTDPLVAIDQDSSRNILIIGGAGICKKAGNRQVERGLPQASYAA